PVTDANNCIDLSELVTKSYLLKMPISANGAGHWSASSTGYTLQKSEQGYITISACESEDSNSISVKR
ncbi:MAG: hypothetical protein NT091_02060, partial [Candidatus Falkowbacteria bacterium]|nr:hypothetical protein [Candidatus Falkowbacteria bacterium]